MPTDDKPKEPGEKPDNERIHSPHNRFVLSYFGAPERAIGLLETQLPASLKRVLHLDQLTVEKSHFVDDNMAEVESDLLFRIPRADRPGQSVFIYVLWEHQRNRDSWMALRVLMYLGMLYRQFIDDGGLTPNGKLPFVYPIVLYQGTKGWKKGLILEDLIDQDGLPSNLSKWIPRFNIDLVRLDKDSPRIQPVDPIAKLGLELMRAVMLAEEEGWLRKHLLELDRLVPRHKNAVIILMNYLFSAGKGLTNEKYQEIIRSGDHMTRNYVPGSLLDQIVKEKDAEIEKAEKQARKAEAEARKMAEESLRKEVAKTIETAGVLIKLGLTDPQISEATQLPESQIAELRTKLRTSDNE